VHTTSETCGPETYYDYESQPSCYLDGKDTIGTQGGIAGNDVLSNIVLGFRRQRQQAINFGELKAASLSGLSSSSTKNGDGDIDCSDKAIANVHDYFDRRR